MQIYCLTIAMTEAAICIKGTMIQAWHISESLFRTILTIPSYPGKKSSIMRSYVPKRAKMIGDVSVFFSEADNCFTLGITVAPLFQKQGYAYELLKELIKQMQDKYPSVDIVALIEKDNTASISLFKKLGFIEECFADSIQSYVFIINGNAN